MKRANPIEAMPQIYRETNSNLTEDKNETHIELPVKPPLQVQENFVPQKSLYNYNLKKIKSFKQIRRKYKLSTQSHIFIHDLSLILQEYTPAEFQFDNELLVHILNIAESYFIYGSKIERNEQKTQAVMQLMKPYYRDDNQLLTVMISSVWNKVNKTNIFKRVIKRIQNNFFSK